MDQITGILVDLAASPWVYLGLFLLVVGDAFLVVLPSETAVVALGALAAATGSPQVGVLVPVAAAGAVLGDLACFTIGRKLGLERWGWMRRGRVAGAIARARATMLTRPAALIFTARYIPYARIAVNLSAGACGLGLRRFLPLSAAAGTTWAIYNLSVGAIFGTALPETPLLAIGLSVLVAVTVGILVDRVVQALGRRRGSRGGSEGTHARSEVPLE